MAGAKPADKLVRVELEQKRGHVVGVEGDGTNDPAARLLDVMQLHSPVTAVLATMIFNAAIIPALIPLSLKGVKFRAEPMERTFVRNMAIYGLGGAVLPFLAIKAIDLLLALVIG